MNKIESEFNTFYQRSIHYLENNWHSVGGKLSLGATFPSYQHSETIIFKINPNLKIDMNQVFREVMELSEAYQKCKSENEFIKLSTKKWHCMFESSKNNSKTIFILVSYLLSIPASSAFSERVFSVMGVKWREERNRCSTKLIRSELLIYRVIKKDCLSWQYN
jgi:hypothetical protein